MINQTCAQTPSTSKASALRRCIYVWVGELTYSTSSFQVRPSFYSAPGPPGPPLHTWRQPPVSQGCVELSSPFMALSFPGSFYSVYVPHHQAFSVSHFIGFLPSTSNQVNHLWYQSAFHGQPCTRRITLPRNEKCRQPQARIQPIPTVITQRSVAFYE